jgi:integrase
MSYTVIIRPKLDYVKSDGTVPIHARITINGKDAWLKLGGQRMLKSAWDSGSHSVKNGVNRAAFLREYMASKLVIVKSVMLEVEQTENCPMTMFEVERIYKERVGMGDFNQTCFIRFAEDYIAWELDPENNAKGKESTLLRTLAQVRILTRFWTGDITKWDGHDRNGKTVKFQRYEGKPLPFATLNNKEFIAKFVGFMKKTYPNNLNAELNGHTMLRKYLKRAKSKRYISTYPYHEDYPDRIIAGNLVISPAVFLEPEELAEITELFFINELLSVESPDDKCTSDYGARMQTVLHRYLVACYSGLRRGDTEKLNKSHLQGNNIVIEMGKSRKGKPKTVRIPTSGILGKLIAYVSPRLKSEKEIAAFKHSGRIFYANPLSGGSVGIYLRAAIGHTNTISKHITFHSSRHTFGVVGLMVGMTIEVIQNILGHQDIKTTQRYAQIHDRLRNTQMKAWDKLTGTPVVPVVEGMTVVNCVECETQVLMYMIGTITQPKMSLTCHLCGTAHKYTILQQADDNVIQLSKAV